MRQFSAFAIIFSVKAEKNSVNLLHLQDNPASKANKESFPSLKREILCQNWNPVQVEKMGMWMGQKKNYTSNFA
jgi:hypothetical protein